MSRCALCCGVGLVVSLCGCPGTQPDGESGAFTLKVVPELVEDSIAGQMCVLLVTMEEDDPAAAVDPITVTATAEGATAVVEHATIIEDQIAEVSVTMLPPADGDELPADNANGWPCKATIRAERGGIVREIEVPIALTSDEEDLLAPAAAEMRDRFIPWLAENRPELGIDEDIEWHGTLVKPHWLVVSHYLYFSDKWEMHVFWHIMIPPSDWARIELRRRFEESLPSLAFEIASVAAPEPVEINEIEPEGTLWR